MTEDLHNEIDDLFRSGLEGKEDTPSKSVWDNIEKSLPGTPVSAIPQKPASIGNFWIKGLVSVTMVAMIGTVVHFRNMSKDSASVPGSPKELSASDLRPAAGSTPKTLPEDEMKELKARTAGEPVVSVHTPFLKTNKESEQILSTPINPDKKEGTGSALASGGPSADIGSSADNRPPNRITSKQGMTEPAEGQVSQASGQTAGTAIPASEKYSSGKSESGLSEKSLTTNRKTLQEKSVVMPAATASVTAINNRNYEPSGIQAIKNTYAGTPAGTPAIGFEERQMATVLSGNTSAAELSPAGHNARSKPQATISGMIPSGSASGVQLANPVTSNPASVKTLKPATFLSRVSITPVAGVNMTGSHMRENESFGGRNGMEHREYRETEEYRTTVSPGILGDFSLTPVISIQTGITELRNNVTVKPRDIKAVKDRDGNIRYRLDCSVGSYYIDPKTGFAPSVGDSIRVSSSEISTRYASIPLQVKFNAGKQRLRYYGLAGIDLNLLAGKNARTMQVGMMEKTVPVRSEGLRSNYVNGVIGGGVDIRLGKRTALSIIPQYRFALRTVNEQSPVQTFPKSFSILSGLRISL
jgi:hypothetical protein